jgi:hypothetical protein
MFSSRNNLEVNACTTQLNNVDLVSPSSSLQEVVHDEDFENIVLDDTRVDRSLIKDMAWVDNTKGFDESNHVALVTPTATARKVFNEADFNGKDSRNAINSNNLLLEESTNGVNHVASDSTYDNESMDRLIEIYFEENDLILN